MKTKMKKYPMLVCMIVSCVLIVASLFILGFFGMNLGSSLGGGSQFKITMSSDASSKDYAKVVKETVSAHGYTVETTFVEDNYQAGDENTDFTQRCLVIKIAKTNISDKDEEYIRYALADNLNINVDLISSIETTTSVVKAKNVLFLGLALGIIVICLFVMAWIRYDILAGLSFILAYLHNIIIYLSILILTRVQLNLISLGVMVVLTLAMSAILIQIYEKFREESRMHTADKMSVSERMIDCETQATKPYLFVAAAVIVFALILFFVPVSSVRFTALGIIIAVIATTYTSLLIGPGSYAALLEVKDYRAKAILSRNDTVNKEIQKKIKKSISKKKTATEN